MTWLEEPTIYEGRLGRPTVCVGGGPALGGFCTLGISVEISGFDKTKSETIFDRWLTKCPVLLWGFCVGGGSALQSPPSHWFYRTTKEKLGHSDRRLTEPGWPWKKGLTLVNCCRFLTVTRQSLAKNKPPIRKKRHRMTQVSSLLLKKRCGSHKAYFYKKVKTFLVFQKCRM